jgi:hypothetical protein
LYAALTDLESPRDWLPSFVKLDKLTEGPWRPGTHWREYRRIMGHAAHEVFEVKAAEPPHALDVYVDGKQGTTGKGYYRYLYVLAPLGASTAITIQGEAGEGGRLAALPAPLLRRMMTRLFARDLAALKAHLEPRATGAGRP